MTQLPHDPILRQILAAAEDAPATVSDTSGTVAPISSAAAATLTSRLPFVAQLHLDGTLSDAQLLAAVRGLVTACEETSVLHHRLQPEQVEAARQRAIDALVKRLDDDTAQRTGTTTP